MNEGEEKKNLDQQKLLEARWRSIAAWADREPGDPQEYFGPAQELLKELREENK